MRGCSSRHSTESYSTLPTSKAQSSALIQMRTEKIGLNGYLYRIERAETAWCNSNNAYQTVEYIVEGCELLRDLRRTHLGLAIVHDYRTYLTDVDLSQKTAKFIIATLKLGQFVNTTATHSQLEEGRCQARD